MTDTWSEKTFGRSRSSAANIEKEWGRERHDCFEDFRVLAFACVRASSDSRRLGAGHFSDYRKGKTAGARAWLEHTKYTPKINSHDKQGRFIRCHTTARYAYSVDGKKYTLEHGFTNVTPGNLESSAKVIYQKKRPNRAYLENISLPTEPFECFVFFFLGMLFLVSGLSILF